MAIASRLVDTNILLRIARHSDPQHRNVDAALALGSVRHGSALHVSEHRGTLERNDAARHGNGLGLSVSEADREVRAIEAGMTLLADSALVYQEWRRIVAKYNVSGVRVYGARLAAAMYVHGIGPILTLNMADFSRFDGLTAPHTDSV